MIAKGNGISECIPTGQDCQASERRCDVCECECV